MLDIHAYFLIFCLLFFVCDSKKGCLRKEMQCILLMFLSTLKPSSYEDRHGLSKGRNRPGIDIDSSILLKFCVDD